MEDKIRKIGRFLGDLLFVFVILNLSVVYHIVYYWKKFWYKLKKIINK